MPLQVRPFSRADRDVLASLLWDASIAPQFDKFQGAAGFDSKLADPVLAQDSIRIATVDGEPAGFGLAWSFRERGLPWFMMRTGVIERFRRRGVGRALADALMTWADAAREGAVADLAASAWMPSEGGEALAARLGFAHERWFWRMDRPRGPVPGPAWPEGVTMRTFDGSEAMLRGWTDAYNDSFAHHFRFVPATIEYARDLVRAPGFRPDGLALAFRDGACIGFCRNLLLESRGEIAVLGVAHASQGIGLGRALLRWGVAWLQSASPAPVTLLVDGQNEGALGLYRSEGFEVALTRRIWSRRLGGVA
jgi:mycothiol synthase